MTDFITCDLCDEYPDRVHVVTGLQWQYYGAHTAFSGQIITVKCFEDNSKVKSLLNTDGEGKVLVVDGGGSLRNALIGDMIGASAVKNHWAGVLIYGACRDVDALATLPIGITALGSVPIKSVRNDEGQVNIPVQFGGVTFTPGHYVYVDRNGVITAQEALI